MLSFTNRTEAYRRLFARLGPGTSYLFTHHGIPAGDRAELGDLEIRIHDFDFWTGDLSLELLAERGARVVSPKGIGEAFRSALDE